MIVILQWRKEQESLKIQMQKKLDIRKQLEVQATRMFRSKRDDKEIERKLMQESVEIMKKMEDETKKAKQLECRTQQEFLKVMF